jgi:hypothetical protein
LRARLRDGRDRTRHRLEVGEHVACGHRQALVERPPGRGVIALGASDPVAVLCVDSQSTRGGALLVDMLRGPVRFVPAAVLESSCTGKTTKVPRAIIASTSTAPCTSTDFVDASAGAAASLVSRHVSCSGGPALF